MESDLPPASGFPEPMAPDGPFGAEPPPVPVPDHQLLRRIGKGSYGEVWLARNAMGAYRAVKIVDRKAFQEQRPFDRELEGIQKFEPVSRTYEGFIDVLHVGIGPQREYFYYVMELGDDSSCGSTIDPDTYVPRTLARDLAQRGRLPFEESLQLGLSLSNALAHLHQRGLVHRDIKPSNIIFVNGIPKLADIGLVAAMSEARSYVGTEGYIPPEGPGTAAADVYSLGKVLYEASTGRDRHDFPELPTKLDALPDVDRLVELNEVILQACKEEVTKRYQSAEELHAELVLVANGRSVKRLRLLERRLAALKRTASIAAAIAAVLGIVFYQVYQEWRRRSDEQQRQEGADVALGTRTMDAGDLSGALPYVAEALKLDEGSPDRESEQQARYGMILAQCPKIVQMWFLPTRAETAAISPDGWQVLVTDTQGKAQVFDLWSGQPVSANLNPGYMIWDGTFSPDGSLVATASADHTVCIWRVQDGERMQRLTHPDIVYGARFSPDGKQVVTACGDGVARVWDVQTGKLRLDFSANHKALRYAAFSPDGRLIVTASTDGTARLWDAEDGHPVGQPMHNSSWVNYAGFSPDGRQLVTAGMDHKARVWDVATGEKVYPEMMHPDCVYNAEFSPDGRLIVTACLDGAAYLWDAEDHQPLQPNPILHHSGRVIRARFGSDGHRIVTACDDGTVRVWDLAGGEVAPPPVRYSFSRDASRYVKVTQQGMEVCDTVTGGAVSPEISIPFVTQQAELNPDGHYVFAVSAPLATANDSQCEVPVWDSADGKQVGPPLRVPAGLTNLVLSLDGKCLLSYGADTAQTWNVTSGIPLSPPVSNAGTIEGAVLSDAGNLVACWSGSEVRVWAATNGQALYPPLKHSRPVRYVAFSPDSRRLVTACADDGLNKCVAQLWEARTGEAVGPPLEHSDGVLYAAFDSSGQRLATASENFAAFEWDAETGKQLGSPMKHGNQVNSVEFSPDERWLVTASADSSARLWSAANGEPLSPPLETERLVYRARFLPGGRRVLTQDKFGKSRLWQISIDERPNQDQRLLACLLSGNTPPLSSLPNPLPTAMLKTIWEQLRRHYPAEFTTTNQELSGWHEYQAEVCEQNQEWAAAAFHLERLLKLHPKDSAIAERLTRAKSQMSRPHLTYVH